MQRGRDLIPVYFVEIIRPQSLHRRSHEITFLAHRQDRKVAPPGPFVSPDVGSETFRSLATDTYSLNPHRPASTEVFNRNRRPTGAIHRTLTRPAKARSSQLLVRITQFRGRCRFPTARTSYRFGEAEVLASVFVLPSDAALRIVARGGPIEVRVRRDDGSFLDDTAIMTAIALIFGLMAIPTTGTYVLVINGSADVKWGVNVVYFRSQRKLLSTTALLHRTTCSMD